MKSPLLVLSIVWLALTACSNYQYVQLKAEKLDKNEHDQFYYEGDHLRITYHFNGQCTPVIMDIENIGDEAVKIDWTKSAVISNKVSRSYYDRDARFKSERELTFPESYSGEINFKESESFLPPASETMKTSRYNYCPQFETSRFENVPATTDEGEEIKGKKLTFEEGESPLIMENYITYALADSEEDVQVLRHSFYVSELIATQQKPANVEVPSNFSYYGSVDPSAFYAFSIIGIAGIVIILLNQ
ncbi:MAG: hypothetical protein ACQERC_08845 [Bacteroidota bacterium]